ncbi:MULTISPECIES: 50S ribosomal protein L5 [unclassified Candidatus Frackibacter]|jgi:large subunit ribosomal protein L5|uniref:50S ribosomal protein L5 n=1 Tax=unclassified Candidatus Frackibacter TaxID=2648818 RepID=UPI000796CC8E|nr:MULTISPECIES: 50S ribosomal protein L5 [unclassified Candidatus Frackibacter]KXS45777.1 MAG: large subunit ribosomal protein L5 [Candidatus Frackibacter sp. T328-2]SDC22305.1 LSU ribosomal protein L5P [Candidatus Frackibacter sp. WG11]SEM49590.1 LSU ribosomal protein L5P [Candidatus Frackibacter sp. WG12]SFL51091.1 LSU ribosomal protein L5P [Candidatus Frackibacter sp. WG13]
MAILKEKFQEDIVEALMEKFDYDNVMQVPKVKKVILNMGIGEAAEDAKLLDNAVEELRVITGQEPVVTRAKKSIANFKIRKGMPVGCKVTLRGGQMYEFLYKLINVALPRVRDFRGLSTRSFDGRGNYSLGLDNQIVFPEIDVDEVDKTRGMDITIVTDAETDEEAKELLALMGMPFKR